MQNPCAEHIIFSFSENIISRFDVAVNDVVKEFAKRLRFVFEAENLRTCGLYHPNQIIILSMSVVLGLLYYFKRGCCHWWYLFYLIKRKGFKGGKLELGNGFGFGFAKVELGGFLD